MRYQKWSGGKYKIYCYSQDKSKSHLARGGACDNVKIFADEPEKIVLDDIFSLKYEEKDGDNVEADILDVLEKTKISVKKKLSRLYELYSESDDDVLIDEINRRK